MVKIKIDFFSEKIIDAISAGIYQVSVIHNGKEEILYIGESVFVLVRCGAHLFELKKNPGYFGFNNETINNEKIILKFKLLETVDNKVDRKHQEKELIQEKNPILQSGISDRMKPVEEKIQALTIFLKGTAINGREKSGNCSLCSLEHRKCNQTGE